MRDYIIIGSSPTSELCAQVGSDNYGSQSRKECRAFLAQLLRQFGNEPISAAVHIKLEELTNAKIEQLRAEVPGLIKPADQLYDMAMVDISELANSLGMITHSDKFAGVVARLIREGKARGIFPTGSENPIEVNVEAGRLWRPHCNGDAEYIVTTSKEDKKFFCKKHGQDLLKTLAMIKVEKLEK